MGLLTDIFIASPEDEARLDVQIGGPEGQFPTLQGKNMDQIKLATLLQILRGAEPTSDETVATAGRFPMVWSHTEEGPWVLRVPAELSGALASTPLEGLGRIAGLWAQTEEWRLDSGLRAEELVEDLTGLLTELRDLAVDAEAGGKALYLWVCL